MPKRREQIRQELVAYCGLDTLAMVRVWGDLIRLGTDPRVGCSAAARYQRPGAPGVRQFVEGQRDWWLTCPMKLIFQIAAGILLAFFCMSVLSALVFFVGLRAWSQQVPVLNFPPLPSLQHQSMIQSVPVQPWPSLTARPVAVAPDLRCTNYVQGPDGQRHCYEKQSP
jgi:hypothetical protein